jgi:uncharacterized membrane protein
LIRFAGGIDVEAIFSKFSQPEDDAMERYVTVGLTVLAGAALFEAALIPGMVIGGAAVLAPKYLPKLRRQLQPLFDSIARPRSEAGAPPPDRPEVKAPPALPAKLGIGQAVAKTITFRIIVTTLDFTTNYVVIGELATAAGLSTFNLIVGPLFYLAHETAWNYFGPPGADADVPVRLFRRSDADAPTDVGKGSRSVGRWPRRSRSGPSPRSWTSRRTTWWSAMSLRRRASRPSPLLSARSSISAMRSSGTITARPQSAATMRRRRQNSCRRRADPFLLPADARGNVATDVSRGARR